jgi:hypothetical protein
MLWSIVAEKINKVVSKMASKKNTKWKSNGAGSMFSSDQENMVPPKIGPVILF